MTSISPPARLAAAPPPTRWRRPIRRALEAAFCAHNYQPLDVVLASGEGAHVVDTAGRSYLDFLSAYSALNFGHRHPRLVAAARRQLDRLTLTSRAFHNDQLGPFCAELVGLCGAPFEAVLPMNTGAEAVETAIKVARKWGYERKGVAADQARDRHRSPATSTAGPRRSCRSPPTRQPGGGFGPFTAGLRHRALRRRRRGRGGHHAGHRGRARRAHPGGGRRDRPPARLPAPPAGAVRPGRRAARRRRDPVRPRPDRPHVRLPGRGRHPDVYVLGKALGGGIVPLSAVVDPLGRARRDRARRARQHLRRQPAGRRHRPRGRRPAAAGRPPGAGRPPRHGRDRAAARRRPARRPTRARSRACGGRSSSSTGPSAAGRCAPSWAGGACWPRTPTATPSASPHR